MKGQGLSEHHFESSFASVKAPFCYFERSKVIVKVLNDFERVTLTVWLYYEALTAITVTLSTILTLVHMMVVTYRYQR